MRIIYIIMATIFSIANVQASSWTLVSESNPWTSRSAHLSTSFHNRLWVMGGYKWHPEGGEALRDVWSSADGINWTSVTLAAPWNPTSSLYCSIIVYKNKMWLVNQGTRKVWSSADGAIWTTATLSAPWSGRSGANLLVFKDKIWLMGGKGNSQNVTKSDVWCSDNGSSWTLVNAHAPWALSDFGCVAFNDRIWVFGGYYSIIGSDYSLANTTKDIWWSAEGIDWKYEGQAHWKDRMYHTVVTVDAKLWLTGGYSMNGDSRLEDLWCSDNGLHWSPVPVSKFSPYRYNYALAVLGSKICLTGGTSSTNGEVQQYNDVYELSPVFTYRPDSAKGWENYK